MALLGRLAVSATVLVQANANTMMPADNERAKFRSEASMFMEQWQPPLLLSGNRITPARHGDLLLYSVADNETGSDQGSFPKLDFLYPVKWEFEFDAASMTQRVRNIWWLGPLVSLLYVIGLKVGKDIMQDQNPMGLKMPLALWNLFLAVFSFIGAIRCTPHLFVLLYTYGFDYTVCRAAIPMYGNGATGFWVALFVFSKIFELIDTVFLVVRKKSVPFLHWYHHCSVLMYCWHSYAWEMPTGIYFASMNYCVHAIMYFYYFLAAVTKPPKWGMMVTVLQLSQMVVGIYVTVRHLYTIVYQVVPNCDGYVPNLYAALGMYASYFALFAQFFCGRYCSKRDTKSKQKKEA